MTSADFSEHRVFGIFVRCLCPSFVYEYETSLPGPAFIKNVSDKLQAFDAVCESKDNKQIAFFIKASKIFGRVRFGEIHILIKRLEKSAHKISVKFVTQKRMHGYAALSVSVLLIINAILTRSSSGLVLIPIIALIGHVYFWGMLPAKVSRLKRFISSLDD